MIRWLFRARIYLLGLGLLLLTNVVGYAAEPVTDARLQQENRNLQRQVKRLEAQVDAMRDELNSPKLSEILGGIGYIVGIFGSAAWLVAWKKNRRSR